jgi:hypothetical protein
MAPEPAGAEMEPNSLLDFMVDDVRRARTELAGEERLLIGGMGGKLRLGGRYFQLPCYGADKHRTMANLYLTLLAAAGRARDSFGIPDPGLADIDQSGDERAEHRWC